MKTIRLQLTLMSILSVGSLGFGPKASVKEPIEPIKPVTSVNKQLAELGKKLFFEPRLSKSGFISCNSCHNLSRGGTDNLATSIGHNWQQGPINSPTVLNASLNLAQFWDGRAADLKEQAGGPIENPKEMAASHVLVVDVLNSIPQYVKEFKKIFNHKGIEIEQVTQAIAEFEKTLITPNSRFDQWLLGNKDAINQQELEGYQLFKQSGCISCHNGAAVGGNSFQKMGIAQPYKTTNEAKGRIAVTGKEEDKHVFKVPTLRNIELTYPYFHDGSVDTLEQAVDIMAKVQIGRDFTKAENAKIVAFLKTLTGEQPTLTVPILPPSSSATPRPQPFAQ
ncbi:cytochrome-c peroxidase [Aliikangiella maris]|uniref:Cytochrome-c peroxidase n=2 Tax=Aliikangiella maris TaxID=3162458 RepID=A0ABV2BR51_9GAMM